MKQEHVTYILAGVWGVAAVVVVVLALSGPRGMGFGSLVAAVCAAIPGAALIWGKCVLDEKCFAQALWHGEEVKELRQVVKAEDKHPPYEGWEANVLQWLACPEQVVVRRVSRAWDSAYRSTPDAVLRRCMSSSAKLQQAGLRYYGPGNWQRFALLARPSLLHGVRWELFTATPELLDLLHSPCPFVNGLQVRETHILIALPGWPLHKLAPNHSFSSVYEVESSPRWMLFPMYQTMISGLLPVTTEYFLRKNLLSLAPRYSLIPFPDLYVAFTVFGFHEYIREGSFFPDQSVCEGARGPIIYDGLQKSLRELGEGDETLFLALQHGNLTPPATTVPRITASGVHYSPRFKKHLLGLIIPILLLTGILCARGFQEEEELPGFAIAITVMYACVVAVFVRESAQVRQFGTLLQRCSVLIDMLLYFQITLAFQLLACALSRVGDPLHPFYYLYLLCMVVVSGFGLLRFHRVNLTKFHMRRTWVRENLPPCTTTGDCDNLDVEST